MNKINPCLICKGNNPRKYCGQECCPLLAKSRLWARINENISMKDNFLGSAPTIFIGRQNYPKLNVGVMSLGELNESAWVHDSQRYWAKKDFALPKIVNLRSSLINSRKKERIESNSRYIDLIREIAMASSPADLDVSLVKKPTFKLSFDAINSPRGPSAELKKIKMVSNPSVRTKVEKIVSDNDLKATEGLIDLYKSGFDENFLSRLLSSSNLGLKNNRKLVPTRWSITAVDDSLGKNLLQQIKDCPTGNFALYSGNYLGNNYFVLLFPEIWSYELFECYLPNASWNKQKEVGFCTDYEPYQGRKSYAENCAGGYYACRLPILELLAKRKRQASVLVIRVITDEYTLPLGVWVCREATRKAVQSRPIHFASKELMIDYFRDLIRKRFGFDPEMMLSESVLLKNLEEQTKLTKFFG